MQDIQTNPTMYFLYQHQLLDESVVEKVKEFSRAIFDPVICPLCDWEYDLKTRAAWIMIHCGHTFCTSCLYLYFKDSRIRCPMCQKVIKRLKVVEVLPLNPMVHEMLKAKTPPEEIFPINEEFKYPAELQKEINDRDNVQYPSCEQHDDRYSHFCCIKCMALYCRVCQENNEVWCEHHIIDLYQLMPELVQDILDQIQCRTEKESEISEDIE